MKSTKIAAAIGSLIALGSVAPAWAGDLISFDRDGVGGTAPILVNQFDWSANSALAVGMAFTGLKAGVTNSGVNDTFTLYVQGSLSAFLGDPSNFGKPGCSPTGQCSAAGNSEITFIMGASMKLTQGATVSGKVTTFNAQFDPTATTTDKDGNVGGPVNYFQIFYDATADANSRAGTGFSDGTRILNAEVFVENPADTLNFSGQLNQDDTALKKLDSNGSTLVGANPNGDPSQDADPGFGTYQLSNGRINFNFKVLSQVVQFFVTDLDKIGIGANLDSSAALPFTNVDPALQIDTGANGVAQNNGVYDPTLTAAVRDFGTDTKTGSFQGPKKTPTSDAINGTRVMDDFSCADTGTRVQKNCDFMVQQDGATVFTKNTVPEPSTLAMIGSGLALFGLGARRRRKVA